MVIKGNMLRDAFISGANSIANTRTEVDALNVFPVPDGDTGTNMAMTTAAAKREVERLVDSEPVGRVAQVEAAALLRGARGNSGVILSLLFRGFSKGLADKREATARDLADALTIGVDAAYKAVMKPTEGTILTVARLAAEHAQKIVTDDMCALELWREVIAVAKVALEHTPEQLPILKKAGVVDAGGKGLVVFFEGMEAVFAGAGIVSESQKAPAEIPNEKNAAGYYEGEITFTYCTEFLVLRADPLVPPDELRAYLESIGDSAVIVDDDDIIKCHVHTDDPGNALQAGLKYGQITSIKIENMREQHISKRSAAGEAPASEEFPYASIDPSRQYGFVAVAAGDGVRDLFLDLGVDNVVSGGQTMNPSTDDILAAVHATPAKVVYVLPNNKNIIMAAEQSIRLADREVVVLPTRTVPQGLAAMMAFDGNIDVNANLMAMTHAFEKVGTGFVTYAARDSDFDGQKIKQGEILALENNRLSFTDRDIVKAAVKLTRNLVRKDSDKSVTFITILYGQDASEEQANQVKELLEEKLPRDIEIAVIDGGQPVYYFTISVE